MKTLITTLVFFASLQASAIFNFTPLVEGDSALAPIEGHVSVVYDSGHCSINTVCLPTTMVNINYNLFGCVDRMVSYNKIVSNDDGSVDIYVTALNISNEKSMVTMCTAMPMVQEQIFISSGMMDQSDINVYFMGVPENGLE